MNVLIIGCGRVGAALAVTLDGKGHDVSVIDRNPERFDELSSQFGGFTTTGVPIDQDVLKRAGINNCDALFAVTDEDDVNLMASQLARQLYSVPKIFALITDISKSEVFEEMGVKTICPTKLTVSAACSAIEEEGAEHADLNFENHTVHFSSMETPESLIGKTPADIKYETGEALFGIIRDSAGLIMYSGQQMIFAEGDRLIFAVKT
ncbi:MAG: TrkA family potassium uptake protein [Oscillospiraceae bacterium]|nr:TrkA family potassium uptake protein [Oscillospiraceae bacterium]